MRVDSKTVALHLATFSLGLLISMASRSMHGSRVRARECFWRDSDLGEFAYGSKLSHIANDGKGLLSESSPAWKPMLFDAALEINATGQLVRPPTDPPFVGKPTPEIDAAWRHILPGKSRLLWHFHTGAWMVSVWPGPSDGYTQR